jgi:hypothetical protein
MVFDEMCRSAIVHLDCSECGFYRGRALELITGVKMPYSIVKGQLAFQVTNALATVKYICA